MTEFQLDGKFQQISIDPTAHVELGQDVTLRSFVCLEVGNGATLKLGNRVFFNINCSIHCGYHIEIGKDTMFGDGVRIFDSNHQYSNYHVEKIAFNYGKISIGKNCWIGANVVILKGVTIGDNVITGAGAVIHKDIPSNSIVVSKEELIIKAVYYTHLDVYKRQLRKSWQLNVNAKKRRVKHLATSMNTSA